MKKFLVYDPSDAAEPKFFKTLQEAYFHMITSIQSCYSNDRGWDHDAAKNIVLTEVKFKTRKIEYHISKSERRNGEPETAYDYILEKVE